MRQTVRIRGERRLMPTLVAALLATPGVASAEHWGTGLSAPLQGAGAAALGLRSPDITPGAEIALRHVYDQSGCHGGNASPALAWTHPPTGTRSFALLMLDPDAPGGVWWHWAVFDIPAAVSSLQADAGDPTRHLLPQGAVQVHNDFGSLGYAGPCPPPGPQHHYRLLLYALRVANLGLDPGASAAQVAAHAQANALAQAEIVGLYGR